MTPFEPRVVLERGPDDLVQRHDDREHERQEQGGPVDEASRYHRRSRRATIEHMPKSLTRARRGATGKSNLRLPGV